MKKFELKLEVFKWILNHLRTTNLIVSFKYDWIFYNFRRVNCKISED